MKFPPPTGALIVLVLVQLRRFIQKRDRYFNMADDEIAALAKNGDRRARQELDDRVLRFKNENL